MRRSMWHGMVRGRRDRTLFAAPVVGNGGGAGDGDDGRDRAGGGEVEWTPDERVGAPLAVLKRVRCVWSMRGRQRLAASVNFVHVTWRGVHVMSRAVVQDRHHTNARSTPVHDARTPPRGARSHRAL